MGIKIKVTGPTSRDVHITWNGVKMNNVVAFSIKCDSRESKRVIAELVFRDVELDVDGEVDLDLVKAKD